MNFFKPCSKTPYFWDISTLYLYITTYLIKREYKRKGKKAYKKLSKPLILGVFSDRV